jgi:dihydrofolate reductase
MARLIYSPIASLDGYVEDEQGGFEWAAPGDEVLAFVNELERPIGAYLYGRRMYETMVFWETAGSGSDQPAGMRDFAGVKETSGSDITIGGAELAGQAIAAGLVDELHLLLVPIVIGGGKPALPGNVRAPLELVDERRFQSGVVHLHYRIGR